MSTANAPSAVRYRPLLLILALLLMPFIVGGGLYAWGWRPAKAGNHGELLSPPRAVPPLADAAGKHPRDCGRTTRTGVARAVAAPSHAVHPADEPEVPRRVGP